MFAIAVPKLTSVLDTYRAQGDMRSIAGQIAVAPV
jgi:hypothetical protein